MASDWTCFKCSAVNNIADKHCSSCGAQRPLLAEHFEAIGDAKMEVSQDTPEYNSASDSQLSMSIGLARLINQVFNEELTVEQFHEKIVEAFAQIEEVFLGLSAELKNLESQEADYVSMLQGDVEDSYYLLKLAQEQLESFADPSQSAALRLGLRLVEKAEDVFQAVLSKVNQDSQGYDLQGRSDLICSLANDFMNNHISLDDYKSNLKRIDDAVHEWIKSAVADMDESFKIAYAFTGSQFDSLKRVEPLLKGASEKFAFTILALHNQENVLKTAETMAVEKNVSDKAKQQ